MAFPPLLVSLLTSNDIPTHLDALHLVEVAHTLSGQIEDLMKIISVLQAEKEKCRIVLSPVRRIPQELLSEIFSFTLPYTLAEDDREMMTNLSAVCQSWRVAALATHTLWQGVVLTPCLCFKYGATEIDYAHSEELEKVRTWMSRSGSLPKTVRYTRPSNAWPCQCIGGGDVRCEATHPTVMKLLSDGPPIDHFSLHVSSTLCFRNWASLMQSLTGPNFASSRWSNLRSFSLLFRDNNLQTWHDAVDPTRSIFALLPAVTTLRVYLPSRSTAFYHDEDALEHRLLIPVKTLNQLTSLMLGWDWGGTKIADLLMHCSHLESLTIDFEHTDAFTGGEDEPIPESLKISPLVLGRLEALHLRRGSVHILEYIRAPSLLRLEVELNIWRPDCINTVKRIGAFIIDSKIGGSLEYLRICKVVATQCQGPADLPLPPLSALRHLVLDSAAVTGYTFRSIGVDYEEHAAHPQFPSLTHLELLNMQRSEHTLRFELSYLQRRQYAPQCMVTVSYTNEVRLSEATLQDRLLTGRKSEITIRVFPAFSYDDNRVNDY
ncbi:hypothetical protein D9611_012998 [Ephemerocybe angulata]|uniref:F-box domain-containing protein n=1 Tax=Ephemerocybe angulata TaxID=980116 RepID=A0A8H5AUI1_9AGAR|nr:hypothetical protein D9611_012998 [Tulosesus angulatus]